MVVGNGMLANAFSQFKDIDDYIIFASGVSNSKETDNNKFEREFNLLKSYTKYQNKKLIYFSTCSVMDNTLQESPYVKHKINMENMIKYYFSNNLIFRLPIIVGPTENPNTLFNFLRNKLLNNEVISVHKHATRYLIDVEDLTFILPKFILNPEEKRKTINVAFNNKIHILDLINNMANLLSVIPKIQLEDSGYDMTIDNIYFLSQLDSSYINKKIINKYLNQCPCKNL